MFPKAKRPKAPKRTLTTRECADELSITPQLLQDYTGKGCPHSKGEKGKPNRYNAGEVQQWMKAKGLTGRAGRPDTGGSSGALQEARIRKENAIAARYELDVQERTGKLVAVDQVKQQWSTRVTVAKNKLIALGAAVTPQLEGRDAPARQGIIDARVIEILNELAGERQ